MLYAMLRATVAPCVRALSVHVCSSCTFVVAKECSSPVLLKLVLQGLVADWQVDTEILMCDLQSRVATSGEHTDICRVPTPESRHRVSPAPPVTSRVSPISPSPDSDHHSSQDRPSSQSSVHLPLHKQQRISIRNVQKLFDGEQ